MTETLSSCWKFSWGSFFFHFNYHLFFWSECQNYRSLNTADRRMTYGNPNDHCDRGIGSGWFRFQGSAGTRMPTSCPPTQRCNSDAPGWMNGGHPTVADGQVSRQVCFHWVNSGCCEWSTNIKVRNCGSYYVYYLSGTPACSLRYCGTNWNQGANKVVTYLSFDQNSLCCIINKPPYRKLSFNTFAVTFFFFTWNVVWTRNCRSVRHHRQKIKY